MINNSNGPDFKVSEVGGAFWRAITHTSVGATAEALTDQAHLTALVALLINASDETLTVGPNSSGNTISLAPGDQYLIPFCGLSWCLADWYMVASGAGKALNILFAQKI